MAGLFSRLRDRLLGRDRAGRSEAEPQCTFCTKSKREVRRLIAGPGLPMAPETATGPQIFVCDECVATLEEVMASKQEEGAEKRARPDGGPWCSFCRRGHLEVDRMALGARFYRLRGDDGGERIERVVQHRWFMELHGDRSPELVAELMICDECVAACRDVLTADT
jgi:hypothetical protein